MNQTNLMQLNAPMLATLDSLSEYQQVVINDKIGELDKNIFQSKRTKTLKLSFKYIEEIWDVLEKDFNLYSVSEYKANIIEDDFLVSLDWYYDSTHKGFAMAILAPSIKQCNNVIADIESSLSSYLVTDKSISYSILQYDNGAMNETNYQDILDVEFNPLATPFIEDVDKYIENFLNSKAPLLILQGEAGTGKTTFVKQILKTMQEKILKEKEGLKVTYSFDENIFYSSDFYKQLIYDDYDVQVYEDINQVIHKNQEQEINPINKFLSITDGLVSKYKKIIITTNIESKYQLHPALLRPGRCYDVIEFRELKGVEIDNLCDSCAKDLYLQTESINLSEFYAKKDGLHNSKLTLSKVSF